MRPLAWLGYVVQRRHRFRWCSRYLHGLVIQIECFLYRGGYQAADVPRR